MPRQRVGHALYRTSSKLISDQLTYRPKRVLVNVLSFRVEEVLISQ